MRKLRLREVKQLLQGDRGCKQWSQSWAACSWVRTIWSSGVLGETRVPTSACTVKARTTVHHHPLQTGSTLWAGSDLAFTGRQVEDSLGVGWAGMRNWDHRGETKRRVQGQGVITEYACGSWGRHWEDTNIITSPLIMLYNGTQSKCFSWRICKRSFRPATSTSPGNGLAMQILRPHPNLQNQTFCSGASNSGFQKALQGFLCLQEFQKPRGTCPASLFYRPDSDARGPATWTWWSEKNRIPAFRVLVQNLKYFGVWFCFHRRIHFPRIWI